MRLTIGNKILMLLHWLCSLMICVAFALSLIVPDLQGNLIARAEASMTPVGARIAGGVVLALYLALSVATLCLLLRRRKRAERGFITVGTDDKSKTRIAVSAVEQMVRQSVRNIDGITDMKVDIEGLDDAIGIGVTAAIASGAHVPTITGNMQRAITQFVEVNCGVAVQSVVITIDAVSGKGEPSRRRALGKGRAQEDAPAPAYTPEPVEPPTCAPEPVAVDEGDGPEGATVIREEISPADGDIPGEDAPAFDPDKPYVSEFAKDYAAMKARESEGQIESDDTNPAEE